MNGTTDKVKGRVEEAAGVLTNDKKLKNRGKMDQAAGNVKDVDRKDDRQGGFGGQSRQALEKLRGFENVVYSPARSDCTRTIRFASDSFLQPPMGLHSLWLDRHNPARCGWCVRRAPGLSHCPASERYCFPSASADDKNAATVIVGNQANEETDADFGRKIMERKIRSGLWISSIAGLLIVAAAFSGCSMFSTSNDPVDCNIVKTQTAAGQTDTQIASNLNASKTRSRPAMVRSTTPTRPRSSPRRDTRRAIVRYDCDPLTSAGFPDG